MKFAKELEQELVPEWRIKYLDYKTGKKYVKAVGRAIARVSATPNLRRSTDQTTTRRPAQSLFAPGSPFANKSGGGGGGGAGEVDGAGPEEEASLRASPAPLGRSPALAVVDDTATAGERQGLAGSAPGGTRYGSFERSPRLRSESVATDGSRLFALPGPALRAISHTSGQTVGAEEDEEEGGVGVETGRIVSGARTLTARDTHTLTARDTHTLTAREASPHNFWAPARPLPRSMSLLPGRPLGSLRDAVRGALPSRVSLYEPSPRQRLRRLFSVAVPLPAGIGGGGDDSKNASAIGLRALDEVRERERAFFRFLDGELDKVETFYRLKEGQAGVRLDLLREQLHEMRNRRVLEIRAADKGVDGQGQGQTATGQTTGMDAADHDPDADTHPEGLRWAPLRARLLRPGPNSQALQRMVQTPRMTGASGMAPPQRDYVRRRAAAADDAVPYRTAKHKLKLALQEFYRGLELLKAYALLNRTAFRKLNKKYDKAVGARPPYRYMTEKVNRSWFVNSAVTDDLLVAVEDLYARYFERGNHKIAAGKLRALTRRPGDESGSAFRSGLLVGVGAVFAVQGTVSGAALLHHGDAVVRTRASYLLQLYGGYFLMLYLFALFCLDCRVWTRNKINYAFIFELDPRSHLDWRQLAQFPSFFLLLFGLVLWLNFATDVDAPLFLYYPVLLIGISVLLLFLPLPTLWHRSRKWFLYSHWRLFFAGLYPVEFRDFFLGDMYCSLTYATCNVELFFCLYAHEWNNPSRCNSSQSRLLGFFSTLPSIWRALQCIRRYHDTKNVFPHLVNCGKYTMTILSYIFLSLYRIHGTTANLALFIVFSVLNGLYTSIWDLFMDFSLLQAGTRFFLLRDITALKRRWVYYVVMVVDPILRFAWIFYALFTHNSQHSTIVSFLVGVAEVTRRGMWALLRVENEHCGNVAQYKASRDVPLPYHLHDDADAAPAHEFLGLAEDEEDSGRSTAVDGAASVAGAAGAVGAGTPAAPAQPQPVPGTPSVAGTPGTAAASWADEAGTPGTPGTLRRRRTSTAGKKTIATIMAEAHRQDFEKKRVPAAAAASPALATGGSMALHEASSDDDDDEVVDDDDSDDSAADRGLAGGAGVPSGGSSSGHGSNHRD